jgi:hypothetical protein
MAGLYEVDAFLPYLSDPINRIYRGRRILLMRLKNPEETDQM